MKFALVALAALLIAGCANCGPWASIEHEGAETFGIHCRY